MVEEPLDLFGSLSVSIRTNSSGGAWMFIYFNTQCTSETIDGVLI